MTPPRVANPNPPLCMGAGCEKRKPAKFNYCTKCRAKLPKPESACAGCGKSSMGNLFCDKCGTKLGEQGIRHAAQIKFNQQESPDWAGKRKYSLAELIQRERQKIASN